MSYNIHEIEYLKDDRVQGFHIDTPAVEHIYSGYTMPLSGWLVGRKIDFKLLEITIDSSDTSYSIVSFPLSIERADVLEHFQDATIDPLCGFSTRLPILGLPQDTRLSIVAITTTEQAIPVAKIRLTRSHLKTGFQPKLQPIIITTIGRTGSTWLMQLLAKHPAIAVVQQHPYETFALEYWLHLVTQQLLTIDQRLTPVDQQRFSRDFLSNDNRQSWFNAAYADQVINFCQKSIENYYLSVAEEQKLASPRFFAEKIPYFSGKGNTTWRLLSSTVRELYPEAKEIVLVRDFRDMVLSALHFGVKDRSTDFIEKEKPTAYLNVTKEVAEFSAYYKQNHDRTYLLHYEDLLLNTTSTLRSLFTSLSLPCSDDILDLVTQTAPSADESSSRQHITSQSTGNSVARWKRELSPELQNKYTNIFKYNLQLFGYDI